MSRKPGPAHYDYGDGLLIAYFLRWNLHQLLSDPLHLFNATLYYPTPNTLALSENMLGLSLVYSPVNLIFRDSLVLGNLMVLGSFFSTALLAFALFRKWTGSFLFAVFAGVALGFSPIRFAQVDHAQLLNYQPLLASIYFCEQWLRHARKRDAAGLFCMLLLQFSFGVYLFVYNLVVVAAMTPVLLALRARTLPWRRLLVQAVVGGLAMAALMYPIYRPYSQVRRTLGMDRASPPPASTGILATDLVWFHGLNTTHAKWTERFRNYRTGFPWEHTLGLPFTLHALGAASLGVASVMLLRRKTRGDMPYKALVLAAAAATALCLLLMLGPVVSPFGRPWSPQPRIYQLYCHFFPGFASLRVPARMIFPASVGWTILALVPLSWVYRRLRGRARLPGRLVALLLLSTLLLESRTHSLVLKAVPTKHELPPVIDVLARQPKAPVFFWPASLTDRYEYLRIYYNTYFWFPMVNGRTGYLPPEQGILLEQLIQRFPHYGALAILRARGVRYIVVCGQDFSGPGRLEETLAGLNEMARDGAVRHLYVDATDSLWEIQAGPHAAPITADNTGAFRISMGAPEDSRYLGEGWRPAEGPAGGTLRWTRGTGRAQLALALSPAPAGDVEMSCLATPFRALALQFAAEVRRQHEIALDVTDVASQMVRVSVNGRELGRFPLGDERMQSFRVVIPQALAAGVMDVEFEVSGPGTLAAAFPGVAGDTTRRDVAFHRIDFRPLPR